MPPLPYLEFNYLIERALGVVTHTGGITEEASVLRVPCLTLRDNTERPEAVDLGTDELVGTDPGALKPALERVFAGKWKKGREIPLWDGKTAERIMDILIKL